jgi:hypothetical protein
MNMTPTQKNILDRESLHSHRTISSVDANGDLLITTYTKSSIGTGYIRTRTLWGRCGKLWDTEMDQVSNLPLDRTPRKINNTTWKYMGKTITIKRKRKGDGVYRTRQNWTNLYIDYKLVTGSGIRDAVKIIDKELSNA